MPARSRGLRWIPESIANILHDNGIRNREELAHAVDAAVSSVYRWFPADADPEWAGKATTEALSGLAYYFNVPISRLVYEPAAERAAERKIRRNSKRPA